MLQFVTGKFFVAESPRFQCLKDRLPSLICCNYNPKIIGLLGDMFIKTRSYLRYKYDALYLTKTGLIQ